MTRIASCLALCLLSTAACTEVDAPEDDAIDGSFAAGKADGFEIFEGSAEAVGVLDVVNKTSATKLRNDAGLSQGAVDAILAERVGLDGELGTLDDDRIWTLGDLDEVAYVGTNALRKLLAYAEDTSAGDGRRWSMFYTYGNSTLYSRMYILDDGTGLAVDRLNPEVTHQYWEVALHPAALNAMPGLIEAAADGSVETREVALDSLMSEYDEGGLWAYTEDGSELLIREDYVEERGGTAFHITDDNDAEATTVLETIALEHVRYLPR